MNPTNASNATAQFQASARATRRQVATAVSVVRAKRAPSPKRPATIVKISDRAQAKFQAQVADNANGKRRKAAVSKPNRTRVYQAPSSTSSGTSGVANVESAGPKVEATIIRRIKARERSFRFQQVALKRRTEAAALKSRSADQQASQARKVNQAAQSNRTPGKVRRPGIPAYI